jgi:type I restriction enzyme S subunit
MDVFGVSQIDSSVTLGLVATNLAEQQTYDLRRGDVLFIRSSVKPSGVGLTAVVEETLLKTVYSGFLIRFRDQGNLSDRFKRHCFYDEGFRKRVIETSTVSANTNINQVNLRKITLALPPTKAEQEAIAEALSDADALLESLEQLVAKKRQIKHGAMQELLTGQKRLPGFTGQWETKLLGDLITHCSSGATPRRNRPEFYKGNIRWITSGELNYNVITDTIEKITSEAVTQTNLAIIPKGTFLMAITGLEAAGTRGSCGIVGELSTTNQSCMAVFPNSELMTEYLFHYYVFRGDSLALQYCQGTKQQSYTAKLLKKLPIEVPPTTDEQSAIAVILADMDAEIAGLEAKLAKARQVKQGMMQELLTGRIRLV